MTLFLRVLALVFVLLCFVTVVSAESDTSRIPQLINALDDENVRYGASLALARLGSEAVPALQKSLTSGKPEQQVWAAFTLGEIGPAARRAVDDLTQALEKKSDEALRAAAAQALGRIGPEAARSTDALARRLTDEKAQVRRQSAVALGKIGAAAARSAPALIAALPDHRVRNEARVALLQIGKPATAAMLKVLADDNVRFDVATILLKVDAEKAKRNRVYRPTAADLNSLRLVLHDPMRSAAERTPAADALASVGLKGIGVLITAFEKPAIAETAAAAFATAGPAAVAPLVDALKHEQPGVRAAAADALGHIGPAASKSIPALVRAMQDDDRDIRYRAVRALDRFGVKASPAVPDLVALMLDSSQREPARQWAIMALVNTHPVAAEAVVKGLIKASQDKGNYGVSQLARTQVRRIDPKAAEAAGIR